MFSIYNRIKTLTFQRLKGLVRPRPSSTTPLGKSVFGRSTPKQGNSEFLLRSHLNDIMNINQAQILPNRNRSFIMDTQIMYSVVRDQLFFFKLEKRVDISKMVFTIIFRILAIFNKCHTFS